MRLRAPPPLVALRNAVAMQVCPCFLMHTVPTSSDTRPSRLFFLALRPHPFSYVYLARGHQIESCQRANYFPPLFCSRNRTCFRTASFVSAMYMSSVQYPSLSSILLFNPSALLFSISYFRPACLWHDLRSQKGLTT